LRVLDGFGVIATQVFSHKAMAGAWGVKPAQAVEIASKLEELGVLKTGNAGQGYSISKIFRTALGR
jgi:ActR/RegA family two-component response regulator